ncbi:hypothetical protein F4680DRAFT_451761 [Xylaria scruposa]|nr:hypothetical protein F4680DRAFT_451761 [Xylaria scruposa]
MDELRARIEAVERERDEERRQRIEEHRQRIEEHRQRIEERRQREATERQLDEERSQREAAERQRDEERRQRVDFQNKVEDSNFEQYLESYHQLGLKIKVEENNTRTTKGNVTDPTDREYPKRIMPWKDFPSQQKDILDQLSQRFSSDRLFPSDYALQRVDGGNIDPISSETGLRIFEQIVVEKAVRQLVDKIYENEELRASFEIRGSITFNSHTRFKDQNITLSKSFDQMKIEDDVSNLATLPPPTAYTSKGKKGPADQFCIYTSGDYNALTLAIEYKAPHKLSKDAIRAGLRDEVRPDEHVINQPREDFDSSSRYTTVAVIVQLFSYMVKNQVQYGYVSTGETFIFLYIPDDNISDVYYHVCVPNDDVAEQNPDRLYQTSVAQVLAFVLRSLRAEPPPQNWRQTASLETWPDEREALENVIPASPDKADNTTHSPWKGKKSKVDRSPYQTRSSYQTSSSCKTESSNTGSHNKSETEDEGPPASPSISRRLQPSKTAPASTGTTAKASKRGGTKGKAAGPSQKRMAIRDRPFCTHKCLSGMVNGGPVDKDCPNIVHHKKRHITPSTFLNRIRAQLAVDRGRDADAMPLYVSGSIGALFKIRLSSHGYTLVAKGVESCRLNRLEHEKQVYDQLHSIQGKYVPVCVGSLDLVLPYYYDGGVFEHLLFLSFAGKPLFGLPSQADKTSVVAAVDRAFQAIHKSCVIHRDAEPRNILYNACHGDIMIVDFERSLVVPSLRRLGKNRKRRYANFLENGAELLCAKELQSVIQSVHRSIDSNATGSVL